MSNGENKGMQFVITAFLFLLIFLGFYYLFLRDDSDKGKTPEVFDISYIDNGMTYLSDIKGESKIKTVKAVSLQWAPEGTGIYFLDNYSKLKYYDIEEKKSIDVAINISSFEVSPKRINGTDLIAVLDISDQNRLKIINVPYGTGEGGDEIADLGIGISPRWTDSGDEIAFIRDGDIHIARGGAWNEKLVVRAKATDLDISSDGRIILYTEWDGGNSRLMKLDVKSGRKDLVKTSSFEDEPTSASPLGFSSPRFFGTKDEAVFLFNDKSGGRLFSINPEDGEVNGLSIESGPIFSLSISTGDNYIAYFFINTPDQPVYFEKRDGEEIPILLGPDRLNPEFAKKLYDMGDKKEVAGDDVNKYNVERVLDSDIIRIIDIEKGTRWVLGSGQYPVMR